jgi:hypothetical protein
VANPDERRLGRDAVAALDRHPDEPLVRVQAVRRRGLSDEDQLVDRRRVRGPNREPVAGHDRVRRGLDGRPRSLESVRRPVGLDPEFVHPAGGVRATGDHPAVGKEQRVRVVEPVDPRGRKRLPGLRRRVVPLGLVDGAVGRGQRPGLLGEVVVDVARQALAAAADEDRPVGQQVQAWIQRRPRARAVDRFPSLGRASAVRSGGAPSTETGR